MCISHAKISYFWAVTTGCDEGISSPITAVDHVYKPFVSVFRAVLRCHRGFLKGWPDSGPFARYLLIVGLVEQATGTQKKDRLRSQRSLQVEQPGQGVN